jgi:dephospho-CoA kinase
MSKRKVVAVVGLPGSGKTEAMNYFIKKLGWPKVYFGEVTFDEMKKRGMEINEKNERQIREELREKYGKLYYCHETIKKVEAFGSDKSVLVESLYSWEEYLGFKEKFGDDFLIVAVYAPPKIRYARLSKRPVRPLKPEEAKSRDYAQIENLSQAGPIAMADHAIINCGAKEDIFMQLDKIIEELK